MRLKIPEYRQFFRFDRWTLYQLHVSEIAGSFLWQPFKLMLPPDTPFKRGVGPRRVFHLAWNPNEGRLAKSSEAVALERKHPELYADVLTTLSLTFDREWLEGQYEPAEIVAEHSRLAAARKARSTARSASKMQPATP